MEQQELVEDCSEHVVTKEYDVIGADLSLLQGFKFRNHFVSDLAIEIADGSVKQEIRLYHDEHFQDHAQDWVEVKLDEAMFGDVLKMYHRGAKALPMQKLTFRFTLAQRSPLWRHKALDLEQIKPVYKQAPRLNDVRDEDSYGSESEPEYRSRLQTATNQLAMHLGILESLVMRKKRFSQT